MDRDIQFDKLLAVVAKIASKHNWAVSGPQDPCPIWIGDADIIDEAREAIGFFGDPPQYHNAFQRKS